MFYNPQFNKSKNETTGEVNIPLLSQWGEHYNTVYNSIEAGEFVDFSNVQTLRNSKKKNFLIEFSIVGEGVGEAHIDQILRLSNDKDLTKSIDSQLNKYFHSLYVKEWGITNPTKKKSILKNFFKPESVFISENSIGISCSSLLDEEHGLGIYIKDESILIDQADVAFTDADFSRTINNELNSKIDIPSFIYYEKITPKIPKIDPVIIRSDERICFLTIEDSSEKVKKLTNHLNINIPQTNKLSSAETYFKKRLDENNTLCKLSTIENLILIDLLKQFDIKFTTNEFMSSLEYSWQSIFKGNIIDAFSAVLKLYQNYLKDVEKCEKALSEGHGRLGLYRSHLKEINECPVDNNNLFYESE